MPVVDSNITERRDPYFREIYAELLGSLRSNGILRGAAAPRPTRGRPASRARPGRAKRSQRSTNGDTRPGPRAYGTAEAGEEADLRE